MAIPDYHMQLAVMPTILWQKFETLCSQPSALSSALLPSCLILYHFDVTVVSLTSHSFYSAAMSYLQNPTLC